MLHPPAKLSLKHCSHFPVVPTMSRIVRKLVAILTCRCRRVISEFHPA